jgi:outer membrane protein assembly factor BamD
MMSFDRRILLVPVLIVAACSFVACGGPDNVIRDDSQPLPILEADLSTAEGYFAKEDYASAAVAYENFIKKHPLNENIPYALFREGLAYFKVSEDAKREQSTTEKAAEKFSQLILMYPNSKYVSNAMSYLRLCHERLAQYNYNVGIYYFDKGEFNAAILRFQDIITKYPGFGYDEDAKRYIEESKKRLSEEK